MMTSPDRLLTCPEVAHRLAVSPSTIRLWTAQRRIPSVKIGPSAVRYRWDDVEAVIRAGERPRLDRSGRETPPPEAA